jgi:hypothetical protein
MNRPLRQLDLGSNTAISGHWFAEILEAANPPTMVPMLIPGSSLTRSAQDLRLRAAEHGFVVVETIGAPQSADEAALSFIQPKVERRLRVISRNLGRGFVIADE